jgi:type III secretion protein J
MSVFGTNSGRLRRFFAAVACCLALQACNAELYSNLDEREANSIVATLLDRGIPASRIAQKNGQMTVIVDEMRFAEAVRLLNENGLPKDRFANMGEVFKRDGLVASPVQERAQMIFALSEELSRTVSGIDGVLSARVHVVLPENDPLQRALVPSSASVFIRHETTLAINDLIPQIKTLVSNSIAGLSYEKVSVVPVAVAARRSVPTSSAPLSSFLGIWVHSASLTRAMWLIGALAAACTLLLAALIFVIWQERRRNPSLRPLASAS